ncbi:MAG: phosphatidylserine/phosphatidylglycerophosphate/cardiolipin synthase family protein, partial [Nocardioides sp.]|uniref:phospholipase D-like domain-containing protein n=1 Tax=Nocardioides sp. TaxID=35761 RepID=UPI003F0256B7
MTTARVLTYARRALLALFGLQLLLALGLSLVDAYRRRNKKPKPFPVSAPETVGVGDSEITTYTYGQDLFDDMLAAIEGAHKLILFETYIWKDDTVGEQFKTALAAAAERGVEVYCIYDGFANLVVPRSFKQFPAEMKVLRYPTYPAGLRFWDLSRYGRDHRKILVVDDHAAFVGGFNIGTAYATEWRDTHVRITGPAVGDLKRAFADFWNLNRRRRFGLSERPLLLETPSEWEPEIRVHRNVPRLWMFPIRGMYIEAVNKATRTIWMTHAYFLPDADLLESITAASRRGVDVRLLVPHKS